MKKTTFLPAIVAFAAVSFPGFAQNPSSPQGGTSEVYRSASAEPQRFDFDFPGGTPAELATAINEATGRNLDVIVPPGLTNFQIKPISVQGVTLRALLGALNISDSRFLTMAITEEGKPVWAFKVPTPQQDPKVTYYFQIPSKIFGNYTIDEITTAIETGWKSQGAYPMPKLSFDSEKELLKAEGPSEYVRLVSNVLGNMSMKLSDENANPSQPAPQA